MKIFNASGSSLKKERKKEEKKETVSTHLSNIKCQGTENGRYQP